MSQSELQRTLLFPHDALLALSPLASGGHAASAALRRARATALHENMNGHPLAHPNRSATWNGFLDGAFKRMTAQELMDASAAMPFVSWPGALAALRLPPDAVDGDAGLEQHRKRDKRHHHSHTPPPAHFPLMILFPGMFNEFIDNHMFQEIFHGGPTGSDDNSGGDGGGSQSADGGGGADVDATGEGVGGGSVETGSRGGGTAGVGGDGGWFCALWDRALRRAEDAAAAAAASADGVDGFDAENELAEQATDRVFRAGKLRFARLPLRRLLRCASVGGAALLQFRHPMGSLESIGELDKTTDACLRRADQAIELVNAVASQGRHSDVGSGGGARGVRAVHLLGYSNGASVALEFLTRARSRRFSWAPLIKSVTAIGGVLYGTELADSIHVHGHVNERVISALTTASEALSFVAMGDAGSWEHAQELASNVKVRC